VPERRTPPGRGHWLELKGARGNNLKNVDLKLPLGLMTCVTGVSGSGKSSLVIETLFHEAQRYFFDPKGYLRGPHCLTVWTIWTR
jgi:excinuclease ABC subunit A